MTSSTAPSSTSSSMPSSTNQNLRVATNYDMSILIAYLDRKFNVFETTLTQMLQRMQGVEQRMVFLNGQMARVVSAVGLPPDLPPSLPPLPSFMSGAAPAITGNEQ
jgi:hypothetical protein